MVINSLRALWSEPRPPAQPPGRVWRDWALLGVAVAASLVEAVLRPDRPAFDLPPVTTWLLAALLVSIVLAVSTLWRRTHPLATVVVAFGTLIVWDVARIVAANGATGLSSVAVVLVLPYALLRWGSGREVAIGLGIIGVWLVTTDVADPTISGMETFGFFLFSAALGASIRFHAAGRLRDIEQAKLRQRHELARDLHDTIGHHMSGIVIQAQAGQALAASGPGRSLDVLRTIEQAATRALAETRTIVGVLRAGAGPEDLTPRPGLSDIERLARTTETPAIEVHLKGPLDELPSAVSVALYRIAQESVTNARRHARNVTRIRIEVAGDADQVRLTVRDNGARPTTNPSSPGFGLIGMRERATLLGGTLHAGPGPVRGWVVQATLPTRAAVTDGSGVSEPSATT